MTQGERQHRIDTVNQSQMLNRLNETREERQIRLAESHANQQQANELRSQAFQNSAAQFNENEIAPHFCGLMNVLCQFCSSKNFLSEKPSDGKFSYCCQKGKVKMPKPLDIQGNVLNYPEFLKDLLVNRSNTHHNIFKDQIRSINNAVSFASMGAKIVNVPGRGPYVFKIHGQTYHSISHLQPGSNETPKYAQLYVIDSSQALNYRQQHAANVNVPAEIFDQIDKFFRENNRLAQTFQLMREIEERETSAAVLANNPAPLVSLIFRRDRQSDKRRYNTPTSNEIAMVFLNDDGEPPFERDIRIYPRNPNNPQEKFVNIKILDPNLDPMVYALLYPYGEAGWQPNLPCDPYPGAQANKVRNKVSMLQWKSAQTAIRDEFNPILHSGKLTQQWLVDSYLQVTIIVISN